MNVCDSGFFDRPPPQVAKDLIGVALLFNGVGGIIVETEAYHPEDEASHSFRGQTKRNSSMFGPSGFSYIYLSYGVHWCLNIVCLRGSAVLIRALEPLSGLETMKSRRGVEAPRLLCSGPGRLCQALGLNKNHDGLPLTNEPFELRPREKRVPILAGKRIGISKNMDVAWRFGLKDSEFLSRKF
ncbi:MAG: DNA-3-methyladenine glycosylase [Aestuariivirga sp.]